MAKKPLSEAHRAAISAGQKRSWEKNRPARMAAINRTDVVLKVKRRHRRSLDIVHARNAERSAKLLPLTPDPERDARIAAKARLWQTNVTRATESPPMPMPELHGLQKILCGRLT